MLSEQQQAEIAAFYREENARSQARDQQNADDRAENLRWAKMAIEYQTEIDALKSKIEQAKDRLQKGKDGWLRGGPAALNLRDGIDAALKILSQ